MTYLLGKMENDSWAIAMSHLAACGGGHLALEEELSRELGHCTPHTITTSHGSEAGSSLVLS